MAWPYDQIVSTSIVITVSGMPCMMLREQRDMGVAGSIVLDGRGEQQHGILMDEFTRHELDTSGMTHTVDAHIFVDARATSTSVCDLDRQVARDDLPDVPKLCICPVIVGIHGI